MSGFTDEEIAAELQRRKHQIEQLEQRRREAERQAQLDRADTVCGHCGTPISSIGQHPDFPLCDACDGD